MSFYVKGFEMKYVWLKIAAVIGLTGGVFYYDANRQKKVQEEKAVVFTSQMIQYKLDPKQIQNIYPVANGAIVRVEKGQQDSILLPTNDSYEQLRKKWKGE